MSWMTVIIAVFVLVLMMGAVVLLEIYLAKQPNKWLGLLLPALCFIFSLITVFSLASYSAGSLTITSESADGQIIREEIIETENRASIQEILAMAVPVFFDLPKTDFVPSFIQIGSSDIP